MIRAAIFAALLQPGQPCTSAAPLTAGEPAPCHGLLISRTHAQQAIKCVQVTVPKLQAELTYQARSCEARKASYTAHLGSIELALEAAEQADPWWKLPLVAAAFAGIGFALGSLAPRND